MEIDDQINDDPIGEAYWKIKNGIRLSGMPGFVDSLSARNIISAELTGVIGEQSHGDPKKMQDLEKAQKDLEEFFKSLPTDQQLKIHQLSKKI